MRDLKECREAIDAIDSSILKLFKERMDVACDIAAYKLSKNQGITDAKREMDKLKALRKIGDKLGLHGDFISDVYKQIMSHTCAYERQYILSKINSIDFNLTTSVAYLGDKGSYSYLAAHQYLGGYKGGIEALGCQSFDDIVNAVETGLCHYGVLPIENSSSGSINEVLDALQKTKAVFVGEHYVNIDHAVLGCEHIGLSEITDIYSHPQPFSQCSSWIKELLPHATVHYCKATSEAMQIVSKKHNKTHVAIGSHLAGSLYNLIPLADNIANNIHNYTRFVVISMTQVSIPENLSAKTSLSFSVQKYIPGSLISVLNEFSKAKLNLTKLISRPRLIQDRDTWEEIFFADIEANIAAPVMQEILDKIKGYTSSIKILGCYINADKH